MLHTMQMFYQLSYQGSSAGQAESSKYNVYVRNTHVTYMYPPPLTGSLGVWHPEAGVDAALHVILRLLLGHLRQHVLQLSHILRLKALLQGLLRRESH